MLLGVHPILTGKLLAHLDSMGHSDALVVVDAHFPGHRLGSRLVTLPGLGAPRSCVRSEALFRRTSRRVCTS